MQRLIGATILLMLLTFLNEKAFSAVNCHFDPEEIGQSNLISIIFEDDQLVVNNEKLVELSLSRIRCGNFGKQFRFDGKLSKNLQVVLKSCTSDVLLEGHLINTATNKVTQITCD